MTRRGDAGSIEWTIVLPVFILVVIPFVLQYGFTYHARQVAKVAAYEGATAASYEGSQLNDGETTALEFVRQQASSELLGPVAHATATRDTVRVEVRGRAVRLVPFMPLDVRASAETIRERFKPEGER